MSLSSFGVSSVLSSYLQDANDKAEEIIKKEEKAKEKAFSLGIDYDALKLASKNTFLYDEEDRIIGFLPENGIMEFETAGEEKSLIKSRDIEGYVSNACLKKDTDTFLSDKRTVSPSGFSYVYADETYTVKTGLFSGECPVLKETDTGYEVNTVNGAGYVRKEDAGDVSHAEYFAVPFSDEDYFRDRVIFHALSLEEKVPYVWGGKPVEKDGKITYSYGMDCSGFIDYCVMQVAKDTGYDIDASDYLSTKAISETFSDKDLLTEEMIPGDLGLETGKGTYYTDCAGISHETEEEAVSFSQMIKNATGQYLEYPDSTRHTDHVGIYLGIKDDKPVFIHLNGTTDTVSINEGCFTVYKDLLRINDENKNRSS